MVSQCLVINYMVSLLGYKLHGIIMLSYKLHGIIMLGYKLHGIIMLVYKLHGIIMLVYKLYGIIMLSSKLHAMRMYEIIYAACTRLLHLTYIYIPSKCVLDMCSNYVCHGCVCFTGTWACMFCTFENIPERVTCEMCGKKG